MNEVDVAITEIQENGEIGGYLTYKFLGTAGGIYEKHGIGKTRDWLMMELKEETHHHEVIAVLEVLKILKKHPSIGRATGGYMIKTINAIKSKEVMA